MLTLTIAITVFGGPRPPLCCPNTQNEIKGKPVVTVEYGGALFGTCCTLCPRFFIKDPKEALARAIKLRKTIGAFEYDPITGLRIDGDKASAFSDYKAIRYFFTSKNEKRTFDAKSTKFVGVVKSVAYFCPVTRRETIATKAGGYADYNGTRYFLCDGKCLKAFKANPAKYAANAASAIKELAALSLTK